MSEGISETLYMKAIVNQARTIAEEFVKDKVKTLMAEIEAEAIAKAVVAMDKKLNLVLDGRDYGGSTNTKIILDMTTTVTETNKGDR